MTKGGVALKDYGGGKFFLKKACFTCGSPNAPFGQGVNMLEALRHAKEGNKPRYKKALGRWYCGKCNKNLNNIR